MRLEGAGIFSPYSSGYIPPNLEVNILSSFNFQLKLCGFQDTSFMQIL